MCRSLRKCVNTINLGIDVLLRVRVKRSRIYSGLLPTIYITKTRLNSTHKKISAAIILSVILTFIFFKFYIFEADIRLIYLDTTEDVFGESQQFISTSHEDDWGKGRVAFTGWNYFKKFEDSTYKIQNITITAFKNERSNSGYWVAIPVDDGENQNFRMKEVNKIQLNHFQFFFSHEVRLAIRFLIGGYSRIYMTFEHSLSTDTHNIVINNENMDSQSKSDQNEFCTLIIEPPFGGHVKTIDIAAVPFNQKSFVIIDKIAMAVGNDKRSLHMLYTLFSQGWCGSSIKVQGTEFQTG